MNNTAYLIAVISVITIVTWILRAFPFLLFGSRPLPKTIQYLGSVLPPAIMMVLVFYCLRNMNIGQFPYGIPELIACTLIVILQLIRKNMYLSIIAGTACYMVLIRVV
ncbi:Branched-chain amino acid transport protein AzlD [Oribacterium sp. KHPX15]|uniref:branched-chain amino acid transporter permease n=1 Tax=Oribacterium sp. KHPX15 TaxID=1855342 RepID=UPI00089BF181|nr:AzlD domain-containing protein [Oribacterium sp. KHPX15]SEA29049.1 Branched-chain amino acid transport protein AzlD [Oribacterium sp. KHPX15]